MGVRFLSPGTKTHMITPENNLKAYLSSEHYQRKKQELQREIQREGTLFIDRTCFKKTPEERIKLKEAKKQWRKLKAEEAASIENEQKG